MAEYGTELLRRQLNGKKLRDLLAWTPAFFVSAFFVKRVHCSRSPYELQYFYESFCLGGAHSLSSDNLLGTMGSLLHRSVNK
jgi:hypothetical protein